MPTCCRGTPGCQLAFGAFRRTWNFHTVECHQAALDAEVVLATAIESGDVATLLASIKAAEARQSLPPSFSLSHITQS